MKNTVNEASNLKCLKAITMYPVLILHRRRNVSDCCVRITRFHKACLSSTTNRQGHYLIKT